MKSAMTKNSEVGGVHFILCFNVTIYYFEEVRAGTAAEITEEQCSLWLTQFSFIIQYQLLSSNTTPNMLGPPPSISNQAIKKMPPNLPTRNLMDALS